MQIMFTKNLRIEKVKFKFKSEDAKININHYYIFIFYFYVTTVNIIVGLNTTLIVHMGLLENLIYAEINL